MKRPPLVGAALALVIALFAAAQEPPLSAPPAAPAQPPLTIEVVESRIRDIEAAGEVDAPGTIALGLLREALASMRERSKVLEAAASFAQLADGAPESLKAVQAELQQTTDEVHIDVPPDATLADVRAHLEATTVELEATRKVQADLEAEVTARAERRKAISDEAAAEAKRRQEAMVRLSAPPPADEPAAVRDARRFKHQAEILLAEARIEALREELRSYTAGQDLLDARRRLAEQRVARLQRALSQWQAAVEEAQRHEADRARDAAEAARAAAARQDPIIEDVARANADLAERKAKLSPRLEQAGRQLSVLTDKLAEIEKLFTAAREREAAVGKGNQAIGILLRKHRLALPDVRNHSRQIRSRQGEMNDIQLEQLEHRDRLKDLVDLDRVTERLLIEHEPPLSPSRQEELRPYLREELRRRRDEYLPSLDADLDLYLDTYLVQLDHTERRLVDVTTEYEAYISERILWIQSAQPLGLGDLASAREAAAFLVDPASWSAVGRGLWRDAQDHWAIVLPAALAWLGLFLVRPRLRRAIHDIGERVNRSSSDSFELTLRAAAWTALRAAPWPLLLAMIGWRLSALADPPSFATQLAGPFLGVAPPMFVLLALWYTCRKRGLAEAHFRWKPATIRLLRTNLAWFIPIGIPISLLARMTILSASDAGPTAHGRLLFMSGMAIVFVLFYRLGHPQRGLPGDYLARHQGQWIDRLKLIWFPLLLSVPVILALLATAGYLYTAAYLALRVGYTAWLLVGAILLNSFVLRWLLLVQRRLALAEARKRWEARRAASEAAGETPPESQVPLEEPSLDVAAISAQSRHLLRVAVLVVLLAGAWGIWSEELPALNVLRRVELWSHAREVSRTFTDASGVERVRTVEEITSITLADAGLAALFLLVTYFVGRNIPGLQEILVLRHLPLAASARYAITTLTRYAITIAGIILACGTLGLTWSTVQWLAAAITVGLGFGLQEIFANFVSGIILLFERPIRIGDTVTVGEMSGTVSRIQMRATTIVDWDRKEHIIPNREFVTSRIVNWSLTDSILRLVVPVGLAYGSDTDRARMLLLQVARSSPQVLADPEPRALFVGFGESALNFELRVYIGHVDHMLEVRHGLHEGIARAFREAGIEIAFPQRDIHIRSVSAAAAALTGSRETPAGAEPWETPAR